MMKIISKISVFLTECSFFGVTEKVLRDIPSVSTQIKYSVPKSRTSSDAFSKNFRRSYHLVYVDMNDLFPAFGGQNTTTQFGASSGWFLDITDLSRIHQLLKFTIRVYTIPV